ncbi:MAG: pseudouridine synthase, partial [Gallionella sp.]|nr:pseudouridine synthase [Gallionella sp.]
WIAAGRVSVNGEPATLGMRVLPGDMVKTAHRTIRVGEREHAVRVLLYHKPEGEIVSRDDPEKRATVFDKLPRLRGQKWIAIGRLDFNTSGLLIFTTSGKLANRLMHPSFEVEREYAVRVQGVMTDEQMKQALSEGVELEDGSVTFEKLEDHGGEGFNHWYHVILKEGRNRIVRRTFDALGLPVSRLIRVRFGIINLPPRLKRGMMAELGEGEIEQVMEWVGESKDTSDIDDAGYVGEEPKQFTPQQPTQNRPALRRAVRSARSGNRTGGSRMDSRKTGRGSVKR